MFAMIQPSESPSILVDSASGFNHIFLEVASAACLYVRGTHQRVSLDAFSVPEDKYRVCLKKQRGVFIARSITLPGSLVLVALLKSQALTLLC